MAHIYSRFGVVSDEIHDDIEVAFEVARHWGMGHVDLNFVWGKTVTDMTAEEVRRTKQLAERYNLKITMVAGLPFKSMEIVGLTPEQLLASAVFKQHMTLLEKSMEIAEALNTRLVRIHSFARPTLSPGDSTSTSGKGGNDDDGPGGPLLPVELDCIVAGLREAGRLARLHDMVLGHENVRSCYGNTGRYTGLIVDAVGDDRLKVVWDPANAYASGEVDAVAAGYESVKDHMVHFHAKDVCITEEKRREWVCIGDGEVDYLDHFKRIAQHYTGGITVETHWRGADMDKKAATEMAFERLKKIWWQATS